MRSLVKQSNWVVWRRASAEYGGGKVPYRLDGAISTAAKRDDPTGWGTYAQARDRCSTSQNSQPHYRFEGVGVFLVGDLLAVDIDSCCKVGSESKVSYEPWALQILDRLPVTYTEVSPSGTGLKLFYQTTLATEFDAHHFRPDGLTASSAKEPSISILRRGFSTVTGLVVRRKDIAVKDIAVVDLSKWLQELQTQRARSKANSVGTRRPTLGINRTPALTAGDINFDHLVVRLSKMQRKPTTLNDGSALLLWVVGVCVQQFRVEDRNAIKRICNLYHSRVTSIPLLAMSNAEKSIDARIESIFAKEGITSTRNMRDSSRTGTSMKQGTRSPEATSSAESNWDFGNYDRGI